MIIQYECSFYQTEENTKGKHQCHDNKDVSLGVLGVNPQHISSDS